MKRATLVLALLAAATPAAADDRCFESAADPVPVGVRPGGFDVTRSACTRSDLDVRLGARALIDEPGFYGTLGGNLQLGIRFLERFLDFEWGVGFQVLDVTFAQTAVVTATERTYGPATVHAAKAAELDGGIVAAGLVRVELPFTRSILDTSSAGAQLAGLAMVPVGDRLRLHGRAGLLGWYGSSAGGTTTRGAVVASADAAIATPLPWLFALGGVELQGGWYGGLDHLAARVGAHWRILGPWRGDLGALVPIAGDERLDLALTLGVRRDR